MSTFERKGGNRTATVETVEVSRPKVAAALSARSRELTSEEERVVRTRHGASVPGDTVLEKKASGEVLDELHLLELELMKRYRLHLMKTQGAQARPSAKKDKIVRALKKKG